MKRAVTGVLILIGGLFCIGVLLAFVSMSASLRELKVAGAEPVGKTLTQAERRLNFATSCREFARKSREFGDATTELPQPTARKVREQAYSTAQNFFDLADAAQQHLTEVVPEQTYLNLRAALVDLTDAEAALIANTALTSRLRNIASEHRELGLGLIRQVDEELEAMRKARPVSYSSI
jgi:glycerol-3-phosphate dehydrogenase